jgi:glucose-fructose oxidoreductase
MQPLKVAVTGLGVSRSYLPNYVAAPESRLWMVHDVDAERARATAEQFEVPHWTTRYEDILESDCDVVDVSTPNHFHAEQTIAALHASKHVLCQKPMAPTVAQCRAMINAAQSTGRTLGMMMTWLNNPLADDLRAAITDGHVGKLAMIRVRNAHRGPLLRGSGDHWRKDASNVGGGCFIQLAVHPMRLALSLAGRRVVEVSALADNIHCRHSLGGEDVAAAVCRLDDGTLMTIEAGYSSTGRAVELYGTAGQIVMQAGQVRVELSRPFDGRRLRYGCVAPDRPSSTAEPARTLAIEVGDIRGDRNDGERNQNRRFLQALLANRPPEVSGDDGLHDVAVVEAVARSSAQRRVVTIDEVLAE